MIIFLIVISFLALSVAVCSYVDHQTHGEIIDSLKGDIKLMSERLTQLDGHK